MRRAVILVVSVATIAVALAADVSKPLAMFGGLVAGAILMHCVHDWMGERDTSQREARAEALDERESWLDGRAALTPSATFGTPERVLDEDGWPMPQTPRLEDRVRRGWRVTASASVPTPAEPVVDCDEWAARPLDEAWRRAARDVEHEPLAVKIDRLATPLLDRVDELSMSAFAWFLAQADRVGDWLARHEPSFGWTKRVRMHALDLVPFGAPVVEVVKVSTGEQRVVRFVDVDEGRVLHILTDTAEWRVPAEWLYEPVGAAR